MFYAHLILAKKGPLARVWLAAHWDKKITKAHVFETNIEKSVEGIMQPKVKLALRTSGHLLLGVVRIYSRKAKYLLADCNEAFIKIKMAFRPGMVDLPEGHREANVNAITLPEVFHDFDTALPELNDIDIEAQFSVNQSRADEITMREDYGSLSLSMHDDGFGDMGFEGDTPDLIRGTLDTGISNQLFEENLREANETSLALNEAEISSTRLDGDGFGDEFTQPELFEDDLFGEPPLEVEDNKIESALKIDDGELDEHEKIFLDKNSPSRESSFQDLPSPVNQNEYENEKKNNSEDEAINEKEKLDHSATPPNEDEGFALAPIDATAYKGVTKVKRKRKLIIDEIKNISGEEMKAQLANTSDIVTTLDLAPPTKRLMYWKETGGVEKLFSLPSRSIPPRSLFLNYNRHLLSHFTQLEDFSCLGPNDLLALDSIQNDNESPCIIYNKRGRKRKVDLAPNVRAGGPENVENVSQSLQLPEVREDNSMAASRDMLDIYIGDKNAVDELEDKTNELNSPKQDQTPFLDIISTPGNIHHDATDDFNHGDSSPSALLPSQTTPQHTIESLDLLSNLHAEQDIPLNIQTTGIHTSYDDDWNDYINPEPTKIQNSFEEQMENETNEQFEERVLNKRAAQLFFTVKAHMMKQQCLLLSQLSVNNSRKQAAQKFYSLLVLKKFRALDITQTLAYADIVITRGPLFENPKL